MSDILSKIVENEAKNPSHAYLFFSQSASTAFNKAKEFAMLIVNDKHNISIFPSEGESLSVLDAANIIKETLLKPVSGEKKVVIINHAHNLNDASQNKLLKTLEEPPQGVILILVAAKIHTLLPPVLSRLSFIEVQENEKSYSLDEKLLKAISEILENKITSKNALLAVSRLSLFENKINDILLLFELFFRDTIAKNEKLDNNFLITSQLTLLEKMCTIYSTRACVKILKEISLIRARVYFNANKISVLDNLILFIARINTL